MNGTIIIFSYRFLKHWPQVKKKQLLAVPDILSVASASLCSLSSLCLYSSSSISSYSSFFTLLTSSGHMSLSFFYLQLVIFNDSMTNQRTQQIKTLAANLPSWVQSPELTWYMERPCPESCPLIFICVLCHMCIPPQNIMKISITKDSVFIALLVCI